MSLNTAHIEGGVLIHQGEVILLHAPQAILSFGGSDDLKKLGENTGTSYLTSHRLIFLAKKSNGNFKSFSFPFVCLNNVDVEQPVFGANYLRGTVRAQPDGGWRGEAKFKMSFKAGGAIEFATGMMRAISLAKQMSGQDAAWNQPPPAYFDAVGGGGGAGNAGGAYPAPPSYYNQPGNYYGWAPPAYNFPPPEAGTVYMSEAPPPYPGIGATGPQANNGYTPMYPSQPAVNPGYPQQQPTNIGFSYPPSQPPAYGAYGAPGQQQQQNMGYGNNGPMMGGGGGGVAYANANGGGQAYVPAGAPPPYAPPPMMNKKTD